MEQKRLALALILSAIVMIGWSMFTPQPQESSKDTADIEKQEKEEIKSHNVKKFVSKNERSKKNNSVQKENDSKKNQAKVSSINTPLYSAKISNKGAIIKSFLLKKYKERKEDVLLKEMVSPDIEGTLRLGFSGNSIEGLDDAIFNSKTTSGSVDVNVDPYELVYSWESPQGVIIEKKYTFTPDSYMIGYDVSIKNGSDINLKDNLTLTLFTPNLEDSSRIVFEGPSGYIDNQLHEVDIDDIKEKGAYSGKVTWVSFMHRYFMSAIIPVDNSHSKMKLAITDKTIETQYNKTLSDLKPGTQQDISFKILIAPRSYDMLSRMGYKLDKSINFGWFDILAKPCLWIMNQIYSYIPNFGIAIILLTILTKIIFWPLGNKSYKSMNEMKKVQPLMAEIKEKYKGDKKKIQSETMKLYSTYKINPLGGCLPMVVQIPIFFALYRMLYQAIELRHAPFFGWITDLSAPDRLFSIDYAIPLMDPPFGIPILTLLMGASMFLQQKMTPTTGDETQAKIMMLMPLFMTIIFINFSSGLVLYWLTNNIFSIGQQYYVMKKKQKSEFREVNA